jgi:hypothetical protein
MHENGVRKNDSSPIWILHISENEVRAHDSAPSHRREAPFELDLGALTAPRPADAQPQGRGGRAQRGAPGGRGGGEDGAEASGGEGAGNVTDWAAVPAVSGLSLGEAGGALRLNATVHLAAGRRAIQAPLCMFYSWFSI